MPIPVQDPSAPGLQRRQTQELGPDDWAPGEAPPLEAFLRNRHGLDPEVARRLQVSYPGEARDDMENGDLLFFCSKGFFAWLIRKLSGGPYSHVAMVWHWHDRVVVFESAAKGVHILRAKTKVDQYDGLVDWYEVKGLTQEQRRRLFQVAIDGLDRPYSAWGLLRFAWRRLLGRLPRVGSDRGARPMFCSEYIAWCFERVARDLAPELASEFSSPSALARSRALALKGILKAG
jgi:hypothetical protein